MKLLSNADLGGNEIQNVKFQLLGSDPGSPGEGQFWYNSTSHRPKARLNGSTFDFTDALTLGGNAGSFYLARGNHTGSQLAATISDFDTQVRTSRLDQMAAPTASVSLNSQKVTGLANGTVASDAINLAQLDAARQGFKGAKDPARVAAQANVNLAAPGAAIDGVTMVATDRFLAPAQTTGTQNGIYVWNGSATPATRALDADAAGEVEDGTTIAIAEGTDAGKIYIQNTASGGAAPGAWTQAWTLYSTGGTSYVGTAARITITGNQIDIASTYVGQATITMVGTITTGVWTGTTIAVANGGTGATTAAAARGNLGAIGKYSATYGDGAATAYNFTQATHGLAANGTNQVAVYDATSGAQVYPDITVAPATGTVTVTHAAAPTTNQYRVVIFG